MEYIDNYLYVIDVALLLTLVIFVLRGLIIGTKKMIITSVLKWALVILLVIFSKQITDFLLTTIKIQGISLNDFVYNLLIEKLELEIADNSNLQTLIYAFMRAMVSFVVIYASVCIVSIIIYPIISLFLAIFGIRGKMKEENKTATSRVLGMMLGVFVTIIIFVVCYIPIYGSYSLAKTMEQDYLLIEESTKNSETTDISTTIEGDSTSVIVNIVGNEEYNLFEKYMDEFFVVSMNGTEVRLINEYYNVRKVFPTILKLANGKVDLDTISTLDFKVLIDVLTTTDTKEIAIPIALEILIAKGTFEKNNIDISYEDVNNENWAKEIAYLDSFLKSLVDTYELVKKYPDDYKKIIGDENFSPIISKNIEELFKISLINTYGSELINKVLEDKTQEIENPKIQEILKKIKFNEQIISDIKLILDSLHDIYLLGFIDKDYQPDYQSEKTSDAITDLFNNVFQLSFIKGNEKEIVDLIYNTFKLDKYVDINTLPLDEIDWDQEPTKLANILIEYVHLLGDKNIKDFQIEILTENDTTDFIDALCESELVIKGIVPALNGLLKEKLDTTDFKELKDIIELSTDKETLKQDLKIILEILPQIKDPSTITETEENVQNLLVKMINLSFVKGKEQTFVEKIISILDLNDFLDSFGITLNYEVTNWEEEMKNLGTLMYQAKTIGIENLPDMLNNLNDENAANIKEFLHTVLKLELIQTSIPKMIDKGMTEAGLEEWESIWLSEQQINFDKSLWEEEIDNLIDIMRSYQSLGIDFNNIKTEEVENVKELLIKMTKVRSVKMGYLLSIINDELKKQTNKDKNYLVEPETMNWEEEINTIFGSDGIFISIKNINETTTYQEYGKILDQLKNLQMLKDHFYEFIIDFIGEFSAIKNGDITIDLSQEVLEKVDSFEQELSIIDELDFDAATQSSETIDKLMKSVLLRTQVEKYVMDIIKANDLESYYDQSYLSGDIDSVNEKIADSKKDDDASNDWSWVKEIEVIEQFSSELSELIASPTTANAEALKDTSTKSVIASKMYERAKEMYPVLALI